MLNLIFKFKDLRLKSCCLMILLETLVVQGQQGVLKNYKKCISSYFLA